MERCTDFGSETNQIEVDLDFNEAGQHWYHLGGLFIVEIAETRSVACGLNALHVFVVATCSKTKNTARNPLSIRWGSWIVLPLYDALLSLSYSCASKAGRSNRMKRWDKFERKQPPMISRLCNSSASTKSNIAQILGVFSDSIFSDSTIEILGDDTLSSRQVAAPAPCVQFLTICHSQKSLRRRQQHPTMCGDRALFKAHTFRILCCVILSVLVRTKGCSYQRVWYYCDH